MKTIKKLDITVTYSVGLENIEVPDEVYSELMECYDEGIKMSILDNAKDYGNAFDWLMENIKEKDTHRWGYEIDEIE